MPNLNDMLGRRNMIPHKNNKVVVDVAIDCHKKSCLLFNSAFQFLCSWYICANKCTRRGFLKNGVALISVELLQW